MRDNTSSHPSASMRVPSTFAVIRDIGFSLCANSEQRALQRRLIAQSLMPRNESDDDLGEDVQNPFLIRSFTFSRKSTACFPH
jgi:hypothetical protein